jgi:aspartate/methionine/tyrosine aminotransferase
MTLESEDRFARRTRWNLNENSLSRALAALRAAGTPILDLTRSNPTDCGFEYDKKGIQCAFAHSEILRYVPDPRGMLCARDAVSSYYADLQAPVGPDDLVLTSGTSEGYSFVFRLLCNPGDEVLIPSPGYPLFDFLADLCDVKLVRYPLLYDHGWQIDFSALAAAASDRTRAVIVVHPNNPTGHYTSASEQALLSQFCAERGIALIADEVFLDFSLQRARQKSFVGNDRALTFTLSGISKICGMPQMKLAWIAASGPGEQKMEALARLEVIADAYLSVGTPVQLPAPTLLATRSAFHQQVMTRVKANLRELDAQLSRQSACNRLACEGGWSAGLRVPAEQSDEELAIKLLTQCGVHVHPGHFYDFPQPGHAVVSLIVPEKEFAEGIRRVLAHFSRRM